MCYSETEHSETYMLEVIGQNNYVLICMLPFKGISGAKPCQQNSLYYFTFLLAPICFSKPSKKSIASQAELNDTFSAHADERYHSFSHF